MNKTNETVKRNHKVKASTFLSRFRKEQDGVTAVEFAILGPIFFFMLSSLLEVTLFFFSSQYLDSSVNTVAREVRVGNLKSEASGVSVPLTQETFKQRICEEANLLFTCEKMKIDLKVVANFDDLGGEPPLPSDGALDEDEYSFTLPEAEQIVQLTVHYPWPVYTNFVAKSLANLDGAALMSSVTVFRTEPFN